MRRQREGLVRGVYMVPPPMNTFFRVGLSTALLALRAVGMNVEIHDDLEALVRTLGLHVLPP